MTVRMKIFLPHSPTLCLSDCVFLCIPLCFFFRSFVLSFDSQSLRPPSLFASSIPAYLHPCRCANKVLVRDWDGHRISFSRFPENRSWTQTFEGTVKGRHIEGNFTDSRHLGFHYPWSGVRWAVLDFGLSSRSVSDRSQWQKETFARLQLLIMDGNPPFKVKDVKLVPVATSGTANGDDRDDNPTKHPQNYNLSEAFFYHEIQSPFNQSETVTRYSHGYLAIPHGLQPEDKVPAIVALNGHGGSAWQMMYPPENDIYWYGDANARRQKIVLAIDISHRKHSVFYTTPVNGDDPTHGNIAHPAIKYPGFESSPSDWEEDGERAWDAMRALDYLLTSVPQVDSTRLTLTGLSMGGEITTIAGGMDDRFQMVIPAGFSPDLDVMYHHGNHPCWLWENANVREYVDTSVFHGLMAGKRALMVLTGKQDPTYSKYEPPFASDKQVMRRSREIFADDIGSIHHYLHYDVHRWHAGDVDDVHPDAERYVRTPVEVAPAQPFSQTWQINASTVIAHNNWTIFDWMQHYMPPTL
eukprot:m.160862 g.160862  ORF g.160862 m.160862 type:complete len:525 (+) comp24833_c0_seq4:576-2150(+)